MLTAGGGAGTDRPTPACGPRRPTRTLDAGGSVMTTVVLLPPISTPPALAGPAIAAAYLAERTLARLGGDPFFMGAALVAYRRATGADLAEVAGFLGCPVGALARL